MSERAGAPTLAKRQARVAEMYLCRKSIEEIAAELGIPVATADGDLDWLRQQWSLASKRDPDEERTEELARIAQAERLLWIEWERSRTKQSKSVQSKKPGEDVTTIRQETHFSKPQFILAMLKCIDKRCKMQGLGEAQPRLPDWNLIAEQCKEMDRTVIVPPGYPWPETDGQVA